MELHKIGVSDRSIAKQVGIHRGTVRKYVRSDGFPERGARRYPSKAEPFERILRERWNEGCHNAKTLWKEIRQQGFSGSYHCVRRFNARWRDDRGNRAKSTAGNFRTLSTNQASWLFFKDAKKLSDDEATLKQSILLNCGEIRHAWYVARRFIVMLRRRKGRHLDRWLRRASLDQVPKPLRRFAEGLTRDLEAVVAALTLPWNNGASEGHVGRLKMIKRQMYGRANFDLLRARFLGAA